MKWTIQELIKLENINNEYSDVLDFSDKIEKTDIIAISDVYVDGEFEIFDQEEFVFFTHVECTISMECALTLKPVEVKLSFDTEDVFSTFEDENNYTIDGITVDLYPVLWSNILLEKPMRVISPGAYDEFEYENTEFEDDDINSAFAKLKDYNK